VALHAEGDLMNIAVIGAGNVGSALAEAAAAAGGHNVTISSNDPEDARQLADSADANEGWVWQTGWKHASHVTSPA
jgi:predicted dinucleotide-binding enzyme